MKVKFELENMEGIDGLTSGKEYQFDPADDSIFDDNGSWKVIMTEKDHANCAHLEDRAQWKFVKSEPAA